MEINQRINLKNKIEQDSLLRQKVIKVLGSNKFSNLDNILKSGEDYNEFKNATLVDDSTIDNETLHPLTNIILLRSKFLDLEKLVLKEVSIRDSVEKQVGAGSIEKFKNVIKCSEGNRFIEEDINENIHLYHSIRNIGVKCILERLKLVYSNPRMTPVLTAVTDDIEYKNAVNNLTYLVTVEWNLKVVKAESLNFDLEFLKILLTRWQENPNIQKYQKKKENSNNVKEDLKTPIKTASNDQIQIKKEKNEALFNTTLNSSNNKEVNRETDNANTAIIGLQSSTSQQLAIVSSSGSNNEASQEECDEDKKCLVESVASSNIASVNSKESENIIIADYPKGDSTSSRMSRRPIQKSRNAYMSEDQDDPDDPDAPDEMESDDHDKIENTEKRLNSSLLVGAMQMKNPSSKEEYICTVCQKEFLNESFYKKHLIGVHLNSQMEKELIGNNDKICRFCAKEFSRKQDLLYHVGIVHYTKNLDNIIFGVAEKPAQADLNENIKTQNILITEKPNNKSKSRRLPLMPFRPSFSLKFAKPMRTKEAPCVAKVMLFQDEPQRSLNKLCKLCKQKFDHEDLNMHMVMTHYRTILLQRLKEQQIKLKSENLACPVSLCLKTAQDEEEFLLHFVKDHTNRPESRDDFSSELPEIDFIQPKITEEWGETESSEVSDSTFIRVFDVSSDYIFKAEIDEDDPISEDDPLKEVDNSDENEECLTEEFTITDHLSDEEYSKVDNTQSKSEKSWKVDFLPKISEEKSNDHKISKVELSNNVTTLNEDCRKYSATLDEEFKDFESLNKESSQDIETLDDEPSKCLKTLNDEPSKGLEILDEEYSKGLGSLDEKLRRSLETLDNESSKDHEALDEESIKGLETLNNESSRDLEALHEEPQKYDETLQDKCSNTNKVGVKRKYRKEHKSMKEKLGKVDREKLKIVFKKHGLRLQEDHSTSKNDKKLQEEKIFQEWSNNDYQSLPQESINDVKEAILKLKAENDNSKGQTAVDNLQEPVIKKIINNNFKKDVQYPESINISDENVCKVCNYKSKESLNSHRNSLGHKFKAIRKYSKLQINKSESLENRTVRVCNLCQEEFQEQMIFSHLESIHILKYIKIHEDKLAITHEPNPTKNWTMESKIKEVRSTIIKPTPQLAQTVIEPTLELTNMVANPMTEQTKEPDWFMIFKQFCEERRSMPGIAEFIQSSFKVCNSSTLEYFLNTILSKLENISELDKIVSEIGSKIPNFREDHQFLGNSTLGRQNIENLRIVKRFLLIGEYGKFCEMRGFAVESCEPIHIVTFLSQLQERLTVPKEDIEWTVITISKIHKGVKGDFFNAIDGVLPTTKSQNIDVTHGNKNIGRKESQNDKKKSENLALTLKTKTIVRKEDRSYEEKTLNLALTHETRNCVTKKMPTDKRKRENLELTHEAKNIVRKESLNNILLPIECQKGNLLPKVNLKKIKLPNQSLEKLQTKDAYKNREKSIIKSKSKESQIVTQAEINTNNDITNQDKTNTKNRKRLSENDGCIDIQNKNKKVKVSKDFGVYKIGTADTVPKSDEDDSDIVILEEMKPIKKEVKKVEKDVYFCLECEGCNEIPTCSHQHHPRRPLGFDIAGHFLETGHLDGIRPIGKFMRLKPLSDLAHSTRWAPSIKAELKHISRISKH